ncbi:hypothetical protein JCM18237_00420 [Halorubrum luteum]
MPQENADDEFDPVVELHRQLRATEELPVAREAGWRLGEAQALAADIATGDVDDDVVRRRAEEIGELLAGIDGTEDPEADDHVDAARELADRIASRSPDG